MTCPLFGKLIQMGSQATFQHIGTHGIHQDDHEIKRPFRAALQRLQRIVQVGNPALILPARYPVRQLSFTALTDIHQPVTHQQFFGSKPTLHRQLLGNTGDWYVIARISPRINALRNNKTDSDRQSQ